MKKNKYYFIIVFLVIFMSLTFNLYKKKSVPNNMAISIDIQQEYRNDVVRQLNKILGKNLPVRINSENTCDIIIKHESLITDVQRRDYRVIKLIKDPVVIVDKENSDINNINLKDKLDKFIVGNNKTIDFVDKKLKNKHKLYVVDKSIYKLITKEDIFYGITFLNDFTNNEISNLKVLNINQLNYKDSNYPLSDNICILIKKGTEFDNITEESLRDVINRGER